MVVHNRGRIIEENHYYAFGLKIAGISSNKLPDANEGGIENKYLYNDKELFDDGDLDWYDYGFRNYDAQIGRFTQLDPLTDDYPELTNYQYASNDPIANIDLDGLEGVVSIGGALHNAVGPGNQFFRGLTNLLGAGSAGLSTGLNIANIAGNVYTNALQRQTALKQVAEQSSRSVRDVYNAGGNNSMFWGSII